MSATKASSAESFGAAVETRELLASVATNSYPWAIFYRARGRGAHVWRGLESPLLPEAP